MKYVLLTSLAILSLTASAEVLSSLPAITGGRLEVSNSSPTSSALNTASLVFEYSSCRKMTFSADLVDSRTESNLTMVKLGLTNDMDCFGPNVKRTYKVQVSKDFRNQMYVIMNPIGIAN